MRMLTSILSQVSKELSRTSTSILKIHPRPRPPYFVLPHDHTLIMRKTFVTSSSLQIINPAVFDVNVKARDMIKPFSPTPPHNKTLKISVIDQLSPSFYIPMILFYTNNNHPYQPIDHLELSKLLRRSLSETLVDYYPLAGRIQDNESVDCNDKGVEFCEAYVSEDLMTLIENPNPQHLQELVPFQTKPKHENIVLSVQVNHFSCGGVAVSICISHKIADGAACINFLRAWAGRARGLDRNHAHMKPPNFNAATLFPPKDWFRKICTGDVTICSEKLSSKRLVFSKQTIEQLKARVRSQVNDPTRVEVISAYVWNLLMEAAVAKPGFTKITGAIHAVNLRSRMVPCVPEDTFGNLTWVTTTPTLTNAGEAECPELVNMIRKAIKKIDNGHIAPLLKSECVLELNKEFENVFSGGEKCFFTSLIKFPTYEVNFGMGEPIWTCVSSVPVNNEVIFSSTKCGQGIEAWIHMREQDIALLDDLELDTMP